LAGATALESLHSLTEERGARPVGSRCCRVVLCPMTSTAPCSERLLEGDAFGRTLRASDAVGDTGRDFGTGRVAGGALRLLAGSPRRRGTGRLSAKLHAHLTTELIETHRRINHIAKKESCPQSYQHLGCLVHDVDYRTYGPAVHCFVSLQPVPRSSSFNSIRVLYRIHKKYKFSYHLGFRLKFPSFFSRIPIKAFELT
jgi:hypothetical protein